MSREDYRRQINKVLDKLQDKYKLIKFKSPERNQDTVIHLLKPTSEETLNLPTNYWRYGWNNKLSFAAKVLYLVNLNYTQNSPSGRFSISREKLSKSHGISESFISDGNQHLRKLNLLDIEYGDLEGLRFNERKASIYTLGKLYNPEDLKRELGKLEQKHGKEKLDRAVRTASLVFEENNLKSIQTFIELEDKYGEVTIEIASKKISEKNPDNPKRSAGYLINTVKLIAGENKNIVSQVPPVNNTV